MFAMLFILPLFASAFIFPDTDGDEERVDGTDNGEEPVYETGVPDLDETDGDLWLLGTDSDDTLRGGDGGDTIYGGDGNDTLGGGSGDDTLDGGRGDDTLYGGDGNDALSARVGNNIMYGNDGDDFLFGGIFDDSLSGGDGDDRLVGRGGHNTFTGGNGADSFELSSGGHVGTSNIITDFDPLEDSLIIEYSNLREFDISDRAIRTITVVDWDDGTGADIFYSDQLVASVTGAQGLDPALVGIRGFLNGSYDDDILNGGDGDDGLYGQVGDDTLSGGDGDDRLSGGTGHNTFTGGNGADSFELSGGGHEETTNLITDFDPLEDSLVIDYSWLRELDISHRGTGTITVEDWDNGTGADILYSNQLIASVTGAQGLDPTLIEIKGYIYGSSGDDTVNGSDGNDSLIGANGSDILNGGRGNDFMNGDQTHDFPFAHGDDTLHGGEGDDTLVGLYGQDTLFGDGGNDTLYGGDGTVMTGGDGEDTFYATSHLNDPDAITITDFTPSEDSIMLDVLNTNTVSAPYVVSVENWADGTGADVLVNGVTFAHVAGAQDLDPALIGFGGANPFYH